MGDFDPEYVFSHHSSTPAKVADYDAIHTGAKAFAEVILAHVPECSDRLAVLRLLREQRQYKGLCGCEPTIH